MSYRFRIAVSALCAVLISAPAYANKITKLNISGKSGFGDAPEIEVFSTTGEKWTDVDKTDQSKFSVNLSAKCRFEGKGNKAYEGDLSVPGFVYVSGKKPSNFLIPNSGTASGVFRWDTGTGQSLNPVKVCNDELQKKLANQPNKTKYHILADGFTVNYPAAFTTKFRMYCHDIAGGKTDLGSDTTMVNAKIKCVGSPKAAQKIPKEPVKPKMAKLVPLIKTASFKADPSNYSGKCPTGVKFDGSITANRPGTVTYLYTNHEGKKSPKFTLEFDKAGTKKTRAWSTTVSEKKPNPQGTIKAAGGGSGSNAIQGWTRLDVLTPTQGKIMAKYTVNCNKHGSPGQIQAPSDQPAKPSPVRSTTKTTPTRTQPIQQATPTRVQTTESDD
jgi:hypothetical protein